MESHDGLLMVTRHVSLLIHPYLTHKFFFQKVKK
jgi:hypothetical protein